MVEDKTTVGEDLGLLPEEEIFDETLQELSDGRGEDEDD